MDFQLQLAFNNSSFFENSALILAQRAVAIAERVGLTNLTFDEPTLGDGNCFYRSIAQQMRRPEICHYLHPRFLVLNHHSLRLAVVQFAQDNAHLPCVMLYRQLYDSAIYLEHNNMSWEQFLQHQAQNSVYANFLSGAPHCC